MPVRTYRTTVTSDTTLVTTAETVIATLSGIATNQPGSTIGLSGEATLTTGGSTTGVTLRVREDSLAGSVVDEPTPNAVQSAAGTTETHDINVTFEAAGEYGSKTFVLTAQQIGAAANGSVLQATLEATVTP